MKPFEIQSDEPSKELLDSLFIYDFIKIKRREIHGGFARD